MKKRKRIISKHQPLRTCVACREVRTKRELIRLVRSSSGTVEVDTGGKEAGRGAYLCPTPECWQTGLVAGRLEYTLRTSISRENREQLMEYGKNNFRGVN